MARSFDANTANYLNRTSAVATAVPISMSCWFCSDAIVGSDVTLMCLTDFDAVGAFQFGFDPGKYVFAATHDAGGVDGAISPAIASFNNWIHGAVVFASTTSRTAYISGVAGTTNTASRTPTGIDRTYIGIFAQASALGNVFDGLIAECAIWNVALSGSEISQLALGKQPNMVRPSGLLAYWPLCGTASPEPDIISGLNMTINGSVPAAGHPFYLTSPCNITTPIPTRLGAKRI